MIHHGDCVEVMAAMDAESIDAIVTDPPYGLEFMGKGWDHGVPGVPFWTQALRVAKPGAYLLAFGGTRTVHRLTVALEDAGWIIRDVLVWAYAQGFPKSKSSLKPAWEPIVLARKPGPLQPLNIDACRLPTDGLPLIESKCEPSLHAFGDGLNGSRAAGTTTAGRWPANVILTDPIFDGGWEGVVGGGEVKGAIATRGRGGSVYGGGVGYTTEMPQTGQAVGYGDTGTYSRFFLIPKASRRDREPDVPGELEEHVVNITHGHGLGPVNTSKGGDGIRENKARRNTHPTVKPTRLMRHLVRLVTPEGGTVLDPFLGSGTTAKAAVLEGFDWVGIEREAEYIAIAEQRLVGLEPEPMQLEMTG